MSEVPLQDMPSSLAHQQSLTVQGFPDKLIPAVLVSVRYRSHTQTLIIYKLGFNQNHYTFTLILLKDRSVQ